MAPNTKSKGCGENTLPWSDGSHMTYDILSLRQKNQPRGTSDGSFLVFNHPFCGP